MNWRIFGTIINPKAAIKKNLVVNTPNCARADWKPTNSNVISHRVILCQ
jgi:hypothetical protein